MSVRAITSSGDWTFGCGRADYMTQSKEISQNVVTRLRSFTNDHFINVSAGNNWLQLFGSLGQQDKILRAVEASVMQTLGVVSISNIELTNLDYNRRATIKITYSDVYSQTIEQSVNIL
jgi:hypothetical protein